MSKVKGVEEEKWKHAIGPLTQSELRGGTPNMFVFFQSTKHTKNITQMLF